MNCLNSHFAQDCRSSKCKKCSERHNTLLHKEEQQVAEDQISSDASVNHRNDVTESGETTKVYCIQKSPTKVILSTARVLLRDGEGKTINCRALLDSGSQSNLITDKLAKKVPINTQQRTIGGINRSRTNVYNILRIQVRAINSKFSEEIECMILPSITEELPQTKIDIKIDIKIEIR